MIYEPKSLSVLFVIVLLTLAFLDSKFVTCTELTNKRLNLWIDKVRESQQEKKRMAKRKVSNTGKHV